jgi:hypothetical protein
MYRSFIVIFGTLGSLVSVVAVGCRDNSASPKEGRSQAASEHLKGGDAAHIANAVAKVPRMDLAISDDDARRRSSSALESVKRAVLREDADNSSLIQLVGWRLGDLHTSGRQSIILTYIVIHPVAEQAFWNPADRLSLGLEPLELWAIGSLVVVGQDQKLYSLLDRDDRGTNALVHWAEPLSRVLDHDDRKIEVIETSHVVKVPAASIRSKPGMPLWSTLILTPLSGREAGGDIRVFIGLSESSRDGSPLYRQP